MCRDTCQIIDVLDHLSGPLPGARFLAERHLLWRWLFDQSVRADLHLREPDSGRAMLQLRQRISVEVGDEHREVDFVSAATRSFRRASETAV